MFITVEDFIEPLTEAPKEAVILFKNGDKFISPKDVDFGIAKASEEVIDGLSVVVVNFEDD